MEEKNSGFFTKLFQSGATTFITTIAAAMATYFVTSNFKEKEQQESNQEKEKVRIEAGAETSSRIVAYENKIDSMLRENLRLQMQLNGRQGDNSSTELFSKPVIKLNALTHSMVNGTWVTSDGAEKWVFNNGRVQISSAAGYEGAIESGGNYEASGGKVNGQLHVSRYLYVPVNQDASFEVSLGSNNTALIGTLHMSGNSSAMALYKQ